MQGCYLPAYLPTHGCFSRLLFLPSCPHLPEFDLGPVLKVDIEQTATLPWRYFYLIISKCFAHQSSLSMGSTTITPAQGSHCLKTSFGFRRKYELALGQLGIVVILTWWLEVTDIQIHCTMKPLWIFDWIWFVMHQGWVCNYSVFSMTLELIMCFERHHSCVLLSRFRFTYNLHWFFFFFPRLF